MKSNTGCFRKQPIFWVALLHTVLVSTLTASLWGFSYVSAPSGESCWVIESWSHGTFKPDQETFYQGLPGTDLYLAWESDSDFNTLHTLYVTAIAASAIGLLLSVKEWQTNTSHALGARRSHAIALMLYFCVSFIVSIVIQVCFVRNRCHDHNADYSLALEFASTRQWVDISSSAARVAKASYLTFTLVGGLFTNTLLEHVLLRKARLMGEFDGVMQCCMKSSSILNVVLLVVNAMALPIAFVFFMRMMDDGIKVVGGIEAGETVTSIFNIAIIVIVALHIYITVVLMISFVTLSKRLSEKQAPFIKVLICTIILILSTLVCYGNMAFMFANAYIVLPFDSIVNNACFIIMSFIGASQEKSTEDDKQFCEESSDCSDNRPDDRSAGLDVCIGVERRQSTHSIHSIASEAFARIGSVGSRSQYAKMSCNHEEEESRMQIAANTCLIDSPQMVGPSTPRVIAPSTPQAIAPSTPLVIAPITPQAITPSTPQDITRSK